MNSTPRPACMQRLGLLPPYSIDDVKKAYRNLAKAAHPDGGGNPEAFAALHQDYERALSLACFHESRRHWLGERVESYTDRSQLVEQIEQAGGQAVLQEPHGYLADFGPDFAELLQELVSVHLTGSNVNDALLNSVTSQATFAEVRFLDLSGSAVTDDGLKSIANSALSGLDLRGTAISARGLGSIRKLANLEWLHIGNTRIGMWSRWRLQRQFPDLEIVTDRDAEQPDFESIEYQQLKLMQRLAESTAD